MSTQTLLEAHERQTHREHQLSGVELLLADEDPTRTATHAGVTYRRDIPGVFALLDEVGCGKTKICVDAAQILFLQKRIDTVLALTPGFARSTWAAEDPLLGEVAKHAWTNVPNVVHEFHGNYTDLDLTASGLHWIVSNYEFIRRDDRRDALIRLLRGRRTWMIVDESWCIKGNSDQTRACLMIRRKRADRATILNGTPLSDGKPQDLYHQFAFLDPGIIGAKNNTHFKARYLVTGGFAGKTVVGYQNLEELNARVAPYVRSMKTRDCWDLPPMLDPITIEAPLSQDLWKIYREMRDEMVAWLGGQASVSKQAITKALRLSQITSGFLGGLEDVDADDDEELSLLAGEPTKAVVPSWLRQATGLPSALPGPGPFGVARPVVNNPGGPVTKEIGREKLDAYLDWLKAYGVPHKPITWCRFKPELIRTSSELKKLYPQVLQLRGGQTPDERARVKHFLAPGGDPAPGAVVGITGTGAASLNFSAARVMVFLSHDPALIKRTQAIGRVERPGQTGPMLLVDVVATGPKGQRTIDHHTLKALRGKDDMARWSVNRWRQVLQEE